MKTSNWSSNEIPAACEELEAAKSRPEGGGGANGGIERSLSVALPWQSRTEPHSTWLSVQNIGDLSERQFYIHIDEGKW